jgi:hypothetical protein
MADLTGRWYVAAPKDGEPRRLRTPFRAMTAANGMTGEVDLNTEQDGDRVDLGHRIAEGEWF